MRKKSRAFITCAITGSIHTPSMSPHLPISPLAHREYSCALHLPSLTRQEDFSTWHYQDTLTWQRHRTLSELKE